MRRFVTLFLVLPLTIVVVVLSVANRNSVTFSLDPIGATPALSLTAPLYFFLFAALAIGILFGGIATWIGQKKWRQAARSERANAARHRQEVERLRKPAAASTSIVLGPRHDAT
jgi:hypothetical protein